MKSSRNTAKSIGTIIEIHKRIDQEIDDLLYDFSREHNVEIDLDTVDKLIEQVKAVALRRY